KAGKGKAGGKTREAPSTLTSDLQRARAENTNIVRSIAGYEKEIEVLRAKFAADKKRWIDLKSGAAARAEEAAQPAEAKPVKKSY
ncbi:MAG TPA: hypothetical protein VN878_06600, partial [Usitatibacter sp.]|nr:hypothetical protein [Usitatibacter sp.]